MNDLSPTLGSSLDIPVGVRGAVVIFVGSDKLDSLEEFFGPFNSDTGLAYILCVHGPFGKLSEVLARLEESMSMPVVLVKDHQTLEPDHIYLDSPLVDLVYADGCLSSTARNHVRVASGASSDRLLRSLTVDGSRSAAVLLQGCQLDLLGGLTGLVVHGGQVLVESNIELPKQFPLTGDSAPRALDSRAMLPVLLKHYADLSQKTSDGESARENAQIEKLLRLIEEATQLNFRHYKLATIKRRIANRIKQLGLGNLAAYLDHAAERPSELQTLYEDFMIGVTRFFRDPEAFEVLAEEVIPNLFANHQDGTEIRIWVPGSATGEEAYSVAILCDEYARANPRLRANFKVFASDAHAPSVEIGKNAFYPADSIEWMDSARISRYFVRHNRHYQVAPELRGRVVFATHNLLTDPPFTKIDLICCRNLLIYFNEAAQKKTIGIMLFALQNGGFLFFGPSESPSDFFDYLEPTHSKWRIFRKRKGARMLPPVSQKIVPKKPIQNEVAFSSRPSSSNTTLRNLVDSLMERHMPTSIIVDRSGTLLQTFGDCEPYFSTLSGKVSLSYEEILVPELRMPLQLTLSRAIDTNLKCRFEDCILNDGRKVSLVVEPLPHTPDFPNAVHVIFESRAPSDPEPSFAGESPEEVDRQVLALRRELQETKFQLQESIRQLEYSNNDLQVANEELMTSNEEMQSTNEELQSVNEELFSVNSEFEQKNEDLLSLNEDVTNLLQSTEIGTVFVDDHLRIRKFTPAASSAMHLRDSDLGRPMNHISHTFSEYASLVEDTQRVIATGEPFELEAKTKAGRWLLVRILAFKTVAGEVNGSVITFIDIDALKSAETHILENQRKLTLALEAADFGLWSWDLVAHVSEYDDRFFSLLGLASESEEERDDFLKSAQFGPEFLDRFAIEPISGSFHHSWPVTLNNGNHRYLSARGLVYRDAHGELERISGVVWDETDLKKQEQLILQKKTDLETLLYVVSHDLREPLRAVRSFSKLLAEREKETICEESKDFLRRIEGGATRMNRLLDDVLELSRIDNMVTPTEWVSARDLVAAAIKPLEPKISESAAVVVVSSDLPDLKVNFLYAKQAIYNLVANALKFTPSGRPPEIEIAPYLNPNGKLTGLVVRDRGPGVPEDCRQRIFKLFQRAVNRDVEGTGAGLAIVKQIAQKHGGDAWHEPRPEGGSKFIISFAN